MYTCCSELVSVKRPTSQPRQIWGDCNRHTNSGQSLSMWRPFDVACTLLKLRENVKSLGVTFDRKLSFDKHVNLVCRACNYHLWSLRHIRKYLTVDMANTIACSLVGSRLDYCNSILYKTTKANITKLQHVQNSFAHVVLQMSRWAHADDLLAQLHWLPVSYWSSTRLLSSRTKC